MKPILEIKNVSKKFRLLHNKEPYLSLRDSVASIFRSNTATYEEFYALNDISFNVNQGESVGIIGKNGAGKSTLLKILSKITPPSSGSIISRGRIASLLEVGTGFHPELTGSENIFLNGSILGMKQKEIKAKFDEIVDFSGTEKFLDTPLKHFSSGMQLRLAFAVAAFLDPEILIIDEVLAVGDAEFQKKCLGKMDDVSKQGRTILLVSHNLGSVNELCKKGVCLKNGEIVKYGDVTSVIDYYITDGKTHDSSFVNNRRTEEVKNKLMYVSNVYYTDENRNGKTDFFNTEDVYINFVIEGKTAEKLNLLVNIVNSQNSIVFSAETLVTENIVVLKINKRFLTQGSYHIMARIHIPAVKLEDKIEDTLFFNIIDIDSEWSIYNSNKYFYGSVLGNYEWMK